MKAEKGFWGFESALEGFVGLPVMGIYKIAQELCRL